MMKIFLKRKKLVPHLRENLGDEKNVTLKSLIDYLLKFEESDIKIRKITPLWIEKFQFFLLNSTNLSQGSASLYASALRKQLHLAVREGIIAQSPADSVKNIPMSESKKQPLSLSQLKTLSKLPINGKLGNEVKCAFLFSCLTGLRISDLRTLEWDMIFEDSHGAFWIKKVQKKTIRLVTIPLNESATKILTSIKKSKPENDEKFVFPLLAETRTNTNQYLSKWGAKAGIEHVSWHTARHTFATIALENGAELRTVSELLGHKDISTTLRYAKATDSLKRKAVNALENLLE